MLRPRPPPAGEGRSASHSAARQGRLAFHYRQLTLGRGHSLGHPYCPLAPPVTTTVHSHTIAPRRADPPLRSHTPVASKLGGTPAGRPGRISGGELAGTRAPRGGRGRAGGQLLAARSSRSSRGVVVQCRVPPGRGGRRSLMTVMDSRRTTASRTSRRNRSRCMVSRQRQPACCSLGRRQLAGTRAERHRLSTPVRPRPTATPRVG